MLAVVETLPNHPERQNFAAEGDRQRLSTVALKAFKRIVEEWELTGQQAAGLLGVSTSTWERLKAAGGQDRNLSQDQMTRISALVGIYKGLHLLFADDMAGRWPRLETRGPLFQGATPVNSMLDGGIPQMLEVRRYIDAVRGGL
jgi:uncharacterized protein (DUF2384 family)